MSVVNVAAFAGWVLAKTNGIPFIDGLETSESPQLADAAAATFAAIAVIAAVLAATPCSERSRSAPFPSPHVAQGNRD